MAEEPDYGAGAGSFSAHSSRDKAFEIFVKRTITSIQKEAWGRSKEVKEIREACQAFLNSLDQTGRGSSNRTISCDSNVSAAAAGVAGTLHAHVLWHAVVPSARWWSGGGL
jgi:hypothetical protein